MEKIDVKRIYNELKEKKLSVDEFKDILVGVADIKDFAQNFFSLVTEDIKGDQKNLESIIASLNQVLENSDINQEIKSKIIDALIDIAKKIQEKQWKPDQILKGLGMFLITILAIVFGIEKTKDLGKK
jgi:signal recognition particle GTPase